MFRCAITSLWRSKSTAAINNNLFRTPPKPKLLVSVSNIYCPVSVGKARIGPEWGNREELEWVRTSQPHTKGTFLPVKATRGTARSAKFGMNLLWYPTKPRNWLTPLKQSGTGHDLTSSIFRGSHSKPRLPTICPKNGTDVWNRLHLLYFNWRLYALSL